MPLGKNQNGDESLTLCDASGNARITMTVTPKGPVIVLAGEKHNLLLQSITGAPAITIEQTHGNRRYGVTPFEDGIAISLFDHDGIARKHLVVRADDNGDYRLSVENS